LPDGTIARFGLPLMLCAAFVQGFLSMGFQLVASRLLAPFFGTTIFVWAFIISTFLAAFTIGALAGAWCSRLPARRMKRAVGAIAAIGWLSFAFTSLLGRELVRALDAHFGNLVISLGASCLALFLAPILAMSVMLPLLTEAMVLRGNRGGVSSGVVYATSTMGNITGVMATAFWLIPSFPTSTILLLWTASAAVIFVYFHVVIGLSLPRDNAQGRRRAR
jgi:hypothetical protein